MESPRSKEGWMSAIHRLSDAKVRTASVGRYCDGGGLYLRVEKGKHGPVHGRQWVSTLTTYAEPVLGNLPVQEIDTALVLKVVEPIWTKVPETASRVRGRIELVLNYAAVLGKRSGANPARWKGHLDHLL